MIGINENISIPEDELKFTTSRSSGPGGQNVNKVSTRVTLWFDVAHSPSLNEEQKAVISNKLATRMNKDGLLFISSQRSRSQADNREATVARFTELLRHALQPVPVRKRKRMSLAAKQKRLEDKLHRSKVKRERSKWIIE